jgi:6-pyruvoyltetrahydropterin/6-carboxytetrahydropterin synthase
MKCRLSRRETFTAGHRLYDPPFSDDGNRQVFGKCSNPSGHGTTTSSRRALLHRSTPAPRVLSELIRKLVTEEVDHRNLNTDVESLRSLNPTTEMLVSVFRDRLELHLSPRGLWSV